MADYNTILYQKQRNAVLITLNRPNALNAMNQDMMNELDTALAEAEHDAEIRAVVLTGAGGAFSVGEDISGDDTETEWPYGIPKNSSLNATYNKFRDADRKDILGRQLYRWQYPKPIIGAVSGWCFGAAPGCHITIAADDAVSAASVRRRQHHFIWVALAGFKRCATRSPATTSTPRKRCASA
jgi:enoyl-CoA hydratase/carnithine racemase